MSFRNERLSKNFEMSDTQGSARPAISLPSTTSGISNVVGVLVRSSSSLSSSTASGSASTVSTVSTPVILPSRTTQASSVSLGVSTNTTASSVVPVVSAVPSNVEVGFYCPSEREFVRVMSCVPFVILICVQKIHALTTMRSQFM